MTVLSGKNRCRFQRVSFYFFAVTPVRFWCYANNMLRLPSDIELSIPDGKEFAKAMAIVLPVGGLAIPFGAKPDAKVPPGVPSELTVFFGYARDIDR